MGYADVNEYNVSFDKDKLKFGKTQRFLSKLIEFELDIDTN